MNLIDAFILGLVEGISEYLPISSTGHLIIASALLGLDSPPDVKRSVDAFNIIIQGGAILAVAGLYRGHLMRMMRGLAGRDPTGRRMTVNLMIAFLPAAIVGPLLNDVIEARLFRPVPVMVALAFWGVVMIIIAPWQRRHFRKSAAATGDSPQYIELEHLAWRAALIIGLMQCVAMWPGTSRSMATIVGGMLIGLRPRHAAEFSFLLGLPTLGGACVYRWVKEMTGDGPGMVEVLGGVAPIAVGFVVAFLSAAVAIRWLVTFLGRHGVAVFGWYRIALCVVIGLGVAMSWWDIEPGTAE